MDSDFIQTTKIVNGFWYAFEYVPPESVKNYDTNPFIYCIGPSTTNLNVFCGINLHHLSLSDRIEFIEKFDKLSNFLDTDTRKVYKKEIFIDSIFPGCQHAIRYYNKKNVFTPVRVKNKAVPLYVEYEGDITMNTPGHLMDQYLLIRSKEKTTEARK